MPSKNSIAPKSKSQPKTDQTNEQWHGERYGDLRDKLSTDSLKKLVEAICGKNWDSESAAALVLLMDEIERSQFDRVEIQNIVLTVGSAAFVYTDHHTSAAEKLVLSMRKQYATQEVCHA